MIEAKNKKRKKERGLKGQVIIEFIFCMIIVLLMIYGIMMIFKWSGADMVARRRAHETTLRSPTSDVLQQLDTYFYTPVKMNAIFNP